MKDKAVKITTDSLTVAENFSSIQGEGKNAGTRAVFLRLAGCNLTCGGIDTVKTGELDSGATWRCDTIEVWTKGKRISVSELLVLFEDKGYLSSLGTGAHLVITGGEPFLQESALLNFIKLLPESIFIEVETNGTIVPSKELANRISQFNVSPKLLNSGMKQAERIVPAPLTYFARDTKSIFKFVITHERDWEEIERDFIQPFQIPKSRIWLMPGADCRDKLEDMQKQVVEMAIQVAVNYSPRLHIAIWDKKTGV